MNKKLSTGIQVLLGFLLGIALNAVVVWLGFLIITLFHINAPLSEIGLWGLLFIGATQLVWQIPVILLLRRKRLKAVSLGVILAVSLVALLNATCWAVLSRIRIGG